MSGSKRRVGVAYFKVDGVQQAAKGSFAYNLGRDKQEGFKGSDGSAGIKVIPQLAFIEGEITDSSDLDLGQFVNLKDTTVTLELANGKTIVLHDSWYAGEGTGNTEEGNIACRFESERGEEMKAS